MKSYDYTDQGRGRQIQKRGRPATERRGELNPNAKLTDSEVKMLREYRAAGWTHKELSFLFGVTEGRSSEIVRGLCYKDAGGPIEELNSRRGRNSGRR